MINVAIVGGAGYTAGELLRLLLVHPHVDKIYAESNSFNGQNISAVHTDLYGESDIVFKKIDYSKVDVIFLCSGHGKSRSYLNSVNLPSGIKIIDLGNDFRLKPDNEDFTYGLPEVFKSKIIKSDKIANPGCFATSIELALLPLVTKGLIQDDIHVTGITGSTGAGQSLSKTSHYSWRNSNLSVYKPFTHQHLGEIKQTFSELKNDSEYNINFMPVRGCHTRGIISSCTTKLDANLTDIYNLYNNFYKKEPFTFVSENNIDLKQVVNTNKCLLHIGKENGYIYVISVIDNLLKGASGQAVQNMNLMFGYSESDGLKLKPAAF